MIIEIVNHSESVSQEEAATWAIAVAKQLRLHVAPAWDRLPPVVKLAQGSEPDDPNSFVIRIFDDPDQPGVLGYHAVDRNGRPYGKVFARWTREMGGNPSSVLSHEAAEICGDAPCTYWAIGTDGRLHAQELSDPVQGDEYEIEVGDTKVAVSNFVYPAYYELDPPPGSRFDHMGTLGAPSPAKSPGGYTIDATISNEDQSFAKSVSYGDEYPEWKKRSVEHEASRTSRRTR